MNIASISKVFLLILGLNYHNAFTYTLIRTAALIGCIPFLWLLLVKLYRMVIEFDIKFSFWQYIWVIPALLYLIFFTKIIPDYWLNPINVGKLDIAFLLLWAVTTYVVFYVTLLMLIQNYNRITAMQQKELISAQLKMQESQYEKLLENIENTSRLRHDLRHHLLSINAFAENGDTVDLLNYLKDLNLTYLSNEETSICQNHIVDVILQYYAVIAKERGIEYYTNYMDEFAECLNKGIAPRPDLKEGIHTLAIMEAMQKSMETGAVVKVSEVLKSHQLSLD